MTSFVTSTRLIRSENGAIDSPDQSRQLFDQYDPSEVPEKIFSGDFSLACREKMFIFGIFKLYISNFAYYNLYQRKMKAISRKKYICHSFFDTCLFVTRGVYLLLFPLCLRHSDSNLELPDRETSC